MDTRRGLPSFEARAWLVRRGRVCDTVGLLLNFHALSSGKLVVVEPLLATSPVLTVFLAAIFSGTWKQ